MSAFPVDETLVQDCLQEEGLHDVDTHMSRRHAGTNIVIKLRKEIAGEPRQYNISLSDFELMEFDDPKKLVAMQVSEAARYFKSEMVETIDWEDKRVNVDLHDSYEATCLTCGNEVSLDDLNSPVAVESETSVPRPIGNRDYDSIPVVKRKFALLALLRRSCDELCPNSRYDRKF